MAVVWIPPLLWRLTRGEERVTVPGGTVRQIVRSLEAAYPGIELRLCEDDEVRPEIAVVVDGEVTAEGLFQRLAEDAEVHFVPAITGGRGAPPPVDGTARTG